MPDQRPTWLTCAVSCDVKKPRGCKRDAIAHVWVVSSGRRIRVALCEAHLAEYDHLPDAERLQFAECHGMR